MLSKVMIEALKVEVVELNNKLEIAKAERDELKVKKEKANNEFCAKGREIDKIRFTIENMKDMISDEEEKSSEE